MGAWGCQSFENDDASDWVYALEESRDFSVIEAALDSVVAANGKYLQAPDCSNALAAAEAVAALLGLPRIGLPPEVAHWTAGKPKPPPALVRRPSARSTRSLAGSELKQLWAEGAELGQWEACVQGTKARLQ
jgi:hypothetical protein